MAELYHYNHNHDPRTGKFTFSKGGGVNSRRITKQIKQETKEYRKTLPNKNYSSGGVIYKEKFGNIVDSALNERHKEELAKSYSQVKKYEDIATEYDHLIAKEADRLAKADGVGTAEDYHWYAAQDNVDLNPKNKKIVDTMYGKRKDAYSNFEVAASQVTSDVLKKYGNRKVSKDDYYTYSHLVNDYLVYVYPKKYK